MGKGKKKSGGGGAAAPAGPAMASDETLGSETLDAIEARHELELVEVKKVTAGMTGKKDAMQVLHIEGEVTDRHYLEMRRWEELHETTDGSDDDPVIRDERASDASLLAANLHAASLNPKPVHSENKALNGVTMTKAMKRRLKRETEERERDARVAREIDEARAAGPSAGEAERSKLERVLGSRGLRVKEIKADGHCLYRAIADQLETRVPTHAFLQNAKARDGALPIYATLRALAARVMRGEPETYRPFLTPSDCGLSGESREEGGDGVITDAAWSRYLSDVESTAAWGGQLELQALATGLRVPVEVLNVWLDQDEVSYLVGGENARIKLKDISDEDIQPGYVLCPRAALACPTVRRFEVQLAVGELLEPLASGTVDPAGRDLFGLSALHKFAAWDKAELAELLLPYLESADVNRPAGPERQTPLHAIADMGGSRVLSLLLARRAKGQLTLDLDATDSQGRTAHALALARGHEEVAALLAKALRGGE